MFVPRAVADIELLVSEAVEESETLEFKRQLPDSGKNRDLAQDIAAMANSAGGTLIFGVGESKDRRAESLHPFGLLKVVERVDLVARTAIDEPVQLSELFTIQTSNGEGYLVVVVPRSGRRPHLVEGIPIGRTSAGNCRLSRRELGLLYASDPGFAAEFGVVITKPARIIARFVNQGAAVGTYVPCMVLRNVGDSDAFDVEWDWTEVDGRRQPRVIAQPHEPIDLLPAGQDFWFQIATSASDPITPVHLKWTDGAGVNYEVTQPVALAPA